ncbi:MAG: VOC family protein [Thermomicrobiales bacterium]
MGFSLDHVGVVVRDTTRAAEEFERKFGLTVVADEVLPDLGLRLTYLEGRSGFPVQLVCPLRPGPLMDHLDRHGEGQHHICFATDDIRAAAAALAPGVEVRFNRGGRDRLACFLPDATAGVVIELTETNPSFGGDDGTA